MRNRILIFMFLSVFSVFSMSLLQIPLTSHAANRLTTITNKAPVVVYLDRRKVHDSKLCATPTKNCPSDFIDAGTYTAFCQKKGETVSDLGYTNNWWTMLKAPSGKWGWVNNIYIQGGVKITGVPDCTSKTTLATVYLDNRKIHDFHACQIPAKGCALLEEGIDAGTYPASCQVQGYTVSDLGYTNNWWTKLQTLKGRWGWVNNIYIQGGVKIAGVRDCSSQTKPSETLSVGTPSSTTPSVTVYLNVEDVYNTDNCVTPGKDCSVLEAIDAGTYSASCQTRGEKILDLGYTNDWWTKLQTPSDEWGWVNNIYIQGGVKIAGIPDCPVQSPSPSTPVPPTSYVVCAEGMSPLIKLHQSWGSAYAPTSDLCYNAPMQATETIPSITSLCINGGVTITFRTSTSSDLQTLAGGDYYRLESFDPATTIEITEIRDTSGFHLNYCGIG